MSCVKITPPKPHNHESLRNACIRGAAISIAALLGFSEMGCSKTDPAQSVTEQSRNLMQRIGNSFSMEDRNNGIALSEINGKITILRDAQTSLHALKLEITELSRTTLLERDFIELDSAKRLTVSRCFLGAAQALAKVSFSEVADQQEALSRRLVACSTSARNGKLSPEEIAQVKLLLMPFEISVGSDYGLLKRASEVAFAIEFGTRLEALARRLERIGWASNDEKSWNVRKEELRGSLEREASRLTKASELQAFAAIDTRITKIIALIGSLQTTITNLNFGALQRLESSPSADEKSLSKLSRDLTLASRSLRLWGEGHTELPFWLPDKQHKGRPYYVDEDAPYYKRARFLISNPPRPPSPPSDD